MKKNLAILATMALAAALMPAAFAQQDATSPSSSPAAAQSSPSTSPSSNPSSTTPDASQQASPSSQSGSSAQGASPAGQSSSFTGTVVNANGKYVLKTDSGTYQLDDQDKAKQYEGKQVKVNGSLDNSTSMLHVTDISPASAQ